MELNIFRVNIDNLDRFKFKLNKYSIMLKVKRLTKLKSNIVIFADDKVLLDFLTDSYYNDIKVETCSFTIENSNELVKVEVDMRNKLKTATYKNKIIDKDMVKENE